MLTVVKLFSHEGGSGRATRAVGYGIRARDPRGFLSPLVTERERRERIWRQERRGNAHRVRRGGNET